MTQGDWTPIDYILYAAACGIKNSKSTMDKAWTEKDVSDAFERGKTEGVKEFLSNACNEIDLIQWYIASVDAQEPIWTEAHIKELCKDYILIRK